MTKEICQSCGSCGFPMRTPDDHAGGNINSEYCGTCAEACGRLKPYAEVVQANASYLVRQQGVDQDAAYAMAQALLASMPAWNGRH